MQPPYIFFNHEGGGKFVFGCVIGAIYGVDDEGADAVEFTRSVSVIGGSVATFT